MDTRSAAAAPANPTDLDQPGLGAPGLLGASTDAVLHACRRVDWRFLLPDPVLGHLGYVGPASTPLAEALHQMSAAVVHLGTDSLAADQLGSLDGLVISGAPRQTLQNALRWVRPGGFVYVEVRGLLGRRRGSPGRAQDGSPRQYQRLLEAHGCGSVSRCWHWPEFDDCTRLIPLEAPAPLDYLFRGRSPNRVAQAAWAFAARLLASRLGCGLAPCLSLIARREVLS